MDKFESLKNEVSTYLLRNGGLECAGLVVYLDKKVTLPGFEAGTLILGVHTTSPEKTNELGEKAWDSLTEELKDKLLEAKLGFAVRQI